MAAADIKVECSETSVEELNLRNLPHIIHTDAAIRTSESDYDESGKYIETTSKKRKLGTSPPGQIPYEPRIFKISGTTRNIVSMNLIHLKRALKDRAPTISQEQYRIHKEYLTIKTVNLYEENIIKNMTEIGNIPVKIEENNKQKRITLNKIIIFGVPTDISADEIKEETGANEVFRLLKWDEQSQIRTESNNIVLGYEDEAPTRVFLGFKAFKAKTYIPQPIRCLKCQLFGHKASNCKGNSVCPRCSKNHSVENCTLPKFRENSSEENPFPKENGQELVLKYKCRNCGGGHSSAFRGCSAYNRAKQIIAIKIENKVTYAEAL